MELSTLEPAGDHVWRILGPARQTSTPSAWNGRVFVLFEEEQFRREF